MVSFFQTHKIFSYIQHSQKQKFLNLHSLPHLHKVILAVPVEEEVQLIQVLLEEHMVADQESFNEKADRC